MPATPIYALRYPAQTDPADVPTDLNELATDVETALLGSGRYRGALTAAQFAALTGVADGDVCDLIVDATNGVVWRLRYRAASAAAYKWEFIGGSPLFAEIATAEASGALTAGYGDLTTVGPTITLPRGGDYLVTLSAAYSSDATGTFAFMSYNIGATGAVDADSFGQGGGGMWVSGANVYVASSRTRLKTGLAAVALAVKYKRSAGNIVAFGSRTIAAVPVRIS